MTDLNVECQTDDLPLHAPQAMLAGMGLMGPQVRINYMIDVVMLTGSISVDNLKHAYGQVSFTIHLTQHVFASILHSSNSHSLQPLEVYA